MPFIDVRTSAKLSDDQLNLLQNQLLDIVSEEMGKGIDTIMIGIKDKYRISLGKSILKKGVYIELRAYGHTERSSREAVCQRINEFLVGNFGYEEDNIYITFEDKDAWGYKGQFLG